MSRIFINYRRQDSEGYVGRLYDHLVQHFQDENVFMDVDDIPPGVDFVQALEAAIADCDVLIAVIGPRWLAITNDAGERRIDQWDDFVRIEIASALNQGKLVIPILVGGARMPPPAELPDEIAALARRNAVEISHHRFAYDAQKLASAIKAVMPANPSFKRSADSEIVREKEAALKALRADLVAATDSPLYAFRTESRGFPVLGEGYADANLLFIGESPGKYEAETGQPFCGPSGEVLDEMLGHIGLRRENVFLTNLILDRPPEKRQPTREEIDYYAPFVDRMIDVIRPAVIVPLGRFAMQYILKKFDLPEKREKISQLHGKLLKTSAPYGEIHVVPMFHPAVVLYEASKRDLLRRDFERLKLFI